ncbi:MAG: hypothetical protein IT350_08535 [Deltaproteobacteria bacterium]|nr:hypothetical protein [Deltaproteobacteria bacterium]
MTGMPEPIEPGKSHTTDLSGEKRISPFRGVALGVSVVLFGAAVVGVTLFSFLAPECERDELLKTGVEAKGVIIGIEDTGNRYNEQPQVILKVRVEPKGGDPYETETKMIISPVYLPQFQPGARVNLKYDEADRTKVAVDSVEVRIP